MSNDDLLRRFVTDRGILLGYLRALLPHDLVEDAFQETFLVVTRKIGAFDHTRDFGAWVRGIARLVAKRVRATARDLITLPDDELLARFDQAFDEAPSDEAEDLPHLRRCLERLGAPQRALLQRRYQDGASLAALASEAGKQAGAVQVALSRLRSALFACIEKSRAGTA